MDETNVATRILRQGWLANQAADFQAQVLQSPRITDRKTGELVIHFGDLPTGLYGVVDGAIGVHVLTPEGRSALATIGRRGNWFGQTPLFANRPSTLTFSVIEDTRLLFLPMAKAQEIIAMRPDFTRAFYAVSSYGAENSIANVGSLLVRNPARRIAASLLRVAPGPQDRDDGAAITVNISQEQLGEIANAGRDVVNRASSGSRVRDGFRLATRRSRSLRRNGCRVSLRPEREQPISGEASTIRIRFAAAGQETPRQPFQLSKGVYIAHRRSAAARVPSYAGTNVTGNEPVA